MTLVKFTSVPRAKLGVSLSLQLFSLGPTEFATLRLRGRLGRDGCQVHCGTVLRHTFSTLWQICQNSPTMHFHDQLDLVSRATSKWRIQHAHKWDIQSKQRARRTLPNKRTTLRLLLFFIYGGIYWLCGIISKLYSAIEWLLVNGGFTVGGLRCLTCTDFTDRLNRKLTGKLLKTL